MEMCFRRGRVLSWGKEIVLGLALGKKKGLREGVQKLGRESRFWKCRYVCILDWRS